jgi:glutamyl-tRNA reductase
VVTGCQSGRHVKTHSNTVIVVQDIEKLVVLHRPKDQGGRGLPVSCASEMLQAGLFVDTCLRQVWISTRKNPIRQPDADCKLFFGAQAYSFLLQTVTGLNSSIPGETNVAGQFRCAWKRWVKEATPARANCLVPLMNRLFNDSKMIRRLYLQNLGGASYGTLTRKLMQPERGARILFVGSGKFARSLLPFFDNQQTALWNHRLHPGLQAGEFNSHGTRIFAPREIVDAATWATHLVLTIPPESDSDRLWADLAIAHDIITVVHLARRRGQRDDWLPNDNVRYFDLDDLFELRRNQSTLRDLKVLRARRACEDLARSTATDKPAVGTALPLRA